MLKKSIIGLLLLAIAMPAFAGDDVEKKVFVTDWPVAYKFVPVCETVKVVMKIGFYVKIQKCKKLKIVLGQDSARQYSGCVEFGIMSNFDLELGASIHPTDKGKALQSNLGKWSAWIDGTNFLAPTTSYKKRKVCAKVKEINIVGATPSNSEVHIANVWILVRPTATP